MNFKEFFKKRRGVIGFLIMCIMITNYIIPINDMKVNAMEATNIRELSNKNSNETTKKVYSYLCDNYGKGTLSAQQESTWMGSVDYEFDYIYNATGKKPAIRGLDYMNDDFKGVNERAIKYWNDGGLVTICWHCGSDFSGSWSESMNTNIWDWYSAFTPGTYQYNKLIAGMDKAAQALLELQDEGVTVLWRPFHEFDGEWFWWGKGGSTNFVKLWRMMYDRYTNYWGLNNLIWVCGYSEFVKDGWYPGDEYVDIAGADTYNDISQTDLYNKVVNVAGTTIPIALHECGKLPNIDELSSSTGAKWSWFMVWHTSFVTDTNTKDEFYKVYNNEYVLTLEDLPNFRETSLKKEDANKDGVIDILDISIVANLYNLSIGNNNFNEQLDMNSDGIIDIFDLVYIAKLI